MIAFVQQHWILFSVLIIGILTAFSLMFWALIIAETPNYEYHMHAAMEEQLRRKAI